MDAMTTPGNEALKGAEKRRLAKYSNSLPTSLLIQLGGLVPPHQIQRQKSQHMARCKRLICEMEAGFSRRNLESLRTVRAPDDQISKSQ